MRQPVRVEEIVVESEPERQTVLFRHPLAPAWGLRFHGLEVTASQREVARNSLERHKKRFPHLCGKPLS